MTQEQYKYLVTSYGVHPSRWPEYLRVAALAYTNKHPEHAAKINAGESILDAILDSAILPETDTTLLAARILQTAKSTPQDSTPHIKTPANDHPTQFLAPDTPQNTFGFLQPHMKIMATILLIAIGFGFFAGQSLLPRSDYWAAETLLSYNSQEASYDLSANMEAQP